MSELRFNGTVVARYAEDFNLTGDQAWRMAKSSVEARMVMLQWYADVVKARAMEDPLNYDIHLTSAVLDNERECERGAYAKPEGRSRGDDYPGPKPVIKRGAPPTQCPVCSAAGWSICNCK